jgi:FkbM family methyltransferase
MTLQEYKQKRFEELKSYYHAVTMSDQYENDLILSILASFDIELFIDIGANRGDVTKLVINTKRNIKVMAFEADERIRKKFNEDIKSKNVILYPFALWKKNWIKRLFISEDCTQTSLNFPIIRSWKWIRTKKLDNYFNEIKKYKNILIKIDVEGAEPDVLNGMKKIFKKIKTPMIILFEYSHKWLYSDKERHKIFSTIFSNNYSILRVSPFGLETMGTDISWHLKKYHYSLMVILKGIKFLNNPESISNVNSLVEILPMTDQVNINFNEIEKGINKK